MVYITSLSPKVSKMVGYMGSVLMATSVPLYSVLNSEQCNTVHCGLMHFFGVNFFFFSNLACLNY